MPACPGTVRRASAAVVLAVLLALAALFGGTKPAHAAGCTVGPKLTPTCGSLLGIHPGQSTVAAMENGLGHRFDIVKKYKDFSNRPGAGSFFTPDEMAQVNSGHILHFAWVTKLYVARDASMPAPAGAGGVYTYRQILSGQLDRYIDGIASRVAAVGKPVFFSFNHEPDVTRASFGRAAAGSFAEYPQAYRYIENRFRARGATNAVWTFVVSGFQGDDNVYRTLYPGDAWVDWIGWDPYQHDAGNWASPATVFGRYYNRVEGGMLGSAAAAKPRMLAEFGCMPDSRRPAWFRALPDAFRSMPKLKAAEYFNSGGWGAFYPGDSASTSAFRDVMGNAQFQVTN